MVKILNKKWLYINKLNYYSNLKSYVTQSDNSPKCIELSLNYNSKLKLYYPVTYKMLHIKDMMIDPWFYNLIKSML